LKDIARRLRRGLRVALWATVLNPRVLMWVVAALDRLVVPPWNRAWGLYCRRQVSRMPASSRFLGRVWVNYPDGLTVGEHVRIGRGCFLFCLGGLTIGDGTIISRNVTIYTANHDTSGRSIPYDDQYVGRPVAIGRGVWIGMDARVAPGVTIGDGAIIGMGTVVATDVEPGAIVVGAPQRAVGRREADATTTMLADEAFFARTWPDA
jgi:acetyltransferase-like isoleucine patch superfamily enzyme